MVDTSSLGVISFPFTPPPRIRVPPSPSAAMAEILDIMTHALRDAEVALAKHNSQPTTEEDVVEDIYAFRMQCQVANAIMADTMVHRRLLQSPTILEHAFASSVEADTTDVELAAFYRDMQGHFKQADDIEARFECLPSRWNSGSHRGDPDPSELRPSQWVDADMEFEEDDEDNDYCA
ncbi:Aste57867_24013 [Aphanomyces stellatus]|uniref:Aste57867_24013 protein n=1 Tax=Aphanomyces stellatus TaxID=120398 RepID=A0A485LPA8_9STRA|nr:hypothetical protein As57867_023940 [Aphanomyces stellatus]VFU00656.1 Aste57867_24013 [Aphanomyces stellatus]